MVRWKSLVADMLHLLQWHTHVGDETEQLTGASIASAAWAGTSDIADVAATEAAGTATTLPRGDHVHAVPNGLITLPMLTDGVAATSWTPVISGATTPGTNTYTFQVGRYCRIGPVVFFQFIVTINAVGTAGNAMSGNAQINLPVTAANITNLFGAVVLEANSVDYSANYTQLTGRIAPNSNQMLLKQTGDNQAQANINAATQIVNGSQVIGFGGYFAA